jgi:hypothetical protein
MKMLRLFVLLTLFPTGLLVNAASKSACESLEDCEAVSEGAKAAILDFQKQKADCNSLEDCRTVEEDAQRRITTLLNQGLVGDLLRSSGRPSVSIFFSDAESMCQERGSVLPTARELAEDTVERQRKLGPVIDGQRVDGVALVETKDIDNSQKIPRGFKKENFVLIETEQESFYYSNLYYSRPRHILGRYLFYSNEGVRSDDEFPSDGLYVLNGQRGTLDLTTGAVNSREYKFLAVRCLTPRGLANRVHATLLAAPQ